MKPHISDIIRSSAFQLRNISRIHKYLSRDAFEQIIHSFITSRLDNHNALLYGLPANQRYRLQKIQNTAARILTFSRKSCHITTNLKGDSSVFLSLKELFLNVSWLYRNVQIILLLCIYLNSSHIIHQRVRFVQVTSNFFKKRSQIAAWGDRSFTIAAPQLWNELPFKLRTAKR